MSDELIAFSEVLSSFVAENATREYRRSHLDRVVWTKQNPQFDSRFYSRLLELGVLSAPLKEDMGGLAMGMLSAVVVLEETARGLLPLPVFENLMALYALECLGSGSLSKEVFESWSMGETRFTTSIFQAEQLGFAPQANVTSHPIARLKSKKSGQFALEGTLDFVPGLSWATDLLIPAIDANSDGIPDLYLVNFASQDADLLEAKDQDTFDLIRPYSRVILKGASATKLSEADNKLSGWEDLFDAVHVLAASELSAVAETVVKMTVEYVKTREQFGKPIGAFQAIQQKLANMHMASEQAMSLTRFAAWSADNDRSQFKKSSLAAKAFAGKVVPEIIEDAIQAHGGIGFTYEYDLHLYLRRAKVLTALYGSGDSLSEKLGATIFSE